MTRKYRKLVIMTTNAVILGLLVSVGGYGAAQAESDYRSTCTAQMVFKTCPLPANDVERIDTSDAGPDAALPDSSIVPNGSTPDNDIASVDVSGDGVPDSWDLDEDNLNDFAVAGGDAAADSDIDVLGSTDVDGDGNADVGPDGDGTVFIDANGNGTVDTGVDIVLTIDPTTGSIDGSGFYGDAGTPKPKKSPPPKQTEAGAAIDNQDRGHGGTDRPSTPKHEAPSNDSSGGSSTSGGPNP